MSGSGGFAFSRAHGEDRFYNPPAIRRQQQQQQQQSLLHHRRNKPDASAETLSCTDSDDSTLSKHSVCSSSSASRTSESTTNLDRLIESMTPVVPANLTQETGIVGHRKSPSFFLLGDLWDSFSEWSVYGVGVPLSLNGQDSVIQYYVPFLSGIQLYTEPPKHTFVPNSRRAGDIDLDSSREASSNGSSDCEAADCATTTSSRQNWSAQRLKKMSLNEKTSPASPGLLAFEYLEHEQPHNRKTLVDKISSIGMKFPDIGMYRSCDLLPSSWLSVAWYPIYRIPMGPTLQNLDASFLTFHMLSTHPNARRPAAGKKKGLKISLPAFGMASYKMKGSILTMKGEHEWKKEGDLLAAAENWLRHLHVDLPDFRFFVSHGTQWR